MTVPSRISLGTVAPSPPSLTSRVRPYSLALDLKTKSRSMGKRGYLRAIVHVCLAFCIQGDINTSGLHPARFPKNISDYLDNSAVSWSAVYRAPTGHAPPPRHRDQRTIFPDREEIFYFHCCPWQRPHCV